ncbi:hypothetical protein ACIBEJ_35050 [Nonomuraea sp. NPDC050790]|uniref:hypothetical protein n=1 Tax=Nonomuraea sp. NPDC050790 TaxID=3364371 RepID=UPI00378BE7FF
MAIDYATDVGKVRLLIPDTDEQALLLSDTQIAAFLSMEGAVKLAAASALEVIASSEALVSKVIKTQDVSTDGAKVAAELRARAAGLRKQVDDGVGDDTVGLDIIDFDPHKGYLGYTPG